MRKIGELNFEELLIYSLVIVAITEMILDEKETLSDSIIKSMSDFDFKVQFSKDYIMVITYDSKKHQLYYGDVWIPNGLFEII